MHYLVVANVHCNMANGIAKENKVSGLGVSKGNNDAVLSLGASVPIGPVGAIEIVGSVAESGPVQPCNEGRAVGVGRGCGRADLAVDPSPPLRRVLTVGDVGLADQAQGSRLETCSCCTVKGRNTLQLEVKFWGGKRRLANLTLEHLRVRPLAASASVATTISRSADFIVAPVNDCGDETAADNWF